MNHDGNDKRLTFEQRLARYDLRLETLTADRLLVTRSSRVQLDGLRPERSLYKPRSLATRDLREYKRWIGVDDEIFRRNPRLIGPRLPAFPPYSHDDRKATHPKIKFARSETKEQHTCASDAAKLRADGDLRAAAMAYIYGHSKLVENYRQAIEGTYSDFIATIWTFQEIVIEVDGTLDLGPGSNVLAADRIELHAGASIRSRGALKLDCSNLTQL